MRRTLALILALPAIASAQEIYTAPAPEVVVAPPPVTVTAPPPRAYVPPPPPLPPAPPVYVPLPPVGVVPPHVYIRQRIRWHRRLPVAVPVYAQATPPVVYVNPPPVVVAPAPTYAAPTVAVAAPKPVGWTSRFGLGVRGTGVVNNDSWNNVGIGGEILYRASNRFSLELAGEYQHEPGNALDRWDVPVTFGFRLHIGKPTWIVSPYFVAAAGVDYARLTMTPAATDEALFFDGQVGGGLEIRIGQHVAITADARFDGKKRMDTASEVVLRTRSVNGKPVHALGDEYGGQFRLGVAVYF